MKELSMKKVILPLILVLIVAAVLIIRPWHTASGKAESTPIGQEQVDSGNTVSDPAVPEPTQDPGETQLPDDSAEPDGPPDDPQPQNEDPGEDPGEDLGEDPQAQPNEVPELVVTEELVIDLGEDEAVGGF